MSWTTSIIEKTKDGRVLVRFEETGGFITNATVDPRFLDAEILAAVTRFEALRVVPKGPYIAKTPSPVIPPALTQAQLDELEFMTKQERLRRAMRAVELGLIGANSPVITALRNRLQELIVAYPQFVDLIGG